MHKLYYFMKDFGRMGWIDGLFVAHEDDINDLIGKEIYFGEILGKHSEIIDIIEEKDIKTISDDQDLIQQLRNLFGSNTLCGHNPLEYDEE